MGNNRRVIDTILDAKTTRRTFLGLSAVASMAALAACTSASAGEVGEAGAGDAKRKVALIVDSSINDGGWGSSCYNALEGAAEKMGWDYAYSDGVEEADWSTVMGHYCDDGVDLIMMSSSKMNEVVEGVAKEYPDCHFCILSSTYYDANVECMLPNLDQIGYLAGSLAALLSKSGSIAFVGGVELDTTKTKAAAYQRAAKALDPDIEVATVYAGSYTDVAKGKELAEALITSNGADVIYGDASAVDSGVRETLAKHEGVYNIGQPADLGGADDPVIACSVVTDNQVMLEECMKHVEEGTFGNQKVTGDLNNGAISAGTISDAIVSADVKAAYLELIDRIADGTFDPQ